MVPVAHTGFLVQAVMVYPLTLTPGREAAGVGEGQGGKEVEKKALTYFRLFLEKGKCIKNLPVWNIFFLAFFSYTVHLYYFYIREQYLQCLEIKQSNLN